LVNYATAGGVIASLGIAAGNTLEGVTAAYLVTRFAHGAAGFDAHVVKPVSLGELGALIEAPSRPAERAPSRAGSS
jgi:hypothetical protein